MATINGTAGNDTLTGTAGNDTISGLGGNDLIRAGSTGGADVVDGGADFDSIEFASRATSAVIVDFVAGTISGGSSGTISFTGVERVIAGNFNDRLSGNGSGQTLAGQGGADTLWGAGGVDTLRGGGGADTFVFRETGTGSADSVLDFGSGTDKLLLGGSAMSALGAAGNFAAGDARFKANSTGTATDASDRVVYNTTSRQVFYDADGNGSGAKVLIATLQSGATLVATDIAVEGGGQTINGTPGNDSLVGGPGNDTINGFDGNDMINGGAGADSMVGGAHADTYFVDNPGDVITELDGGGFDTVNASVSYTLPAWVNHLTLTGTASISGTGNELPNAITGNSGNNSLAGGAGNDTLEGLGGDDTLVGGLGDDSLLGGEGNDSLDGGEGFDTMDGGSGNDTYHDTFGAVITDAGGIDTLIGETGALPDGIENLILRPTFHDIGGNGNALDNLIRVESAVPDNIVFIDGEGGNDTIVGTGDAFLFVHFRGTFGNDSVEGSTPGNLIEFRDAGAAVVVDFRTGTAASSAGNVTFTNVTRAIGSDFGDRLTASDAGGELLMGAPGNDTLIGGAGHDNLIGEGGWDHPSVGTGDDSISGGAGNDHIQGNEGNDTLDGGAGDDWFGLRLDFEDYDNDTISGGAGIDEIDITVDSAIVADLAAGTLTGGDLDGTGSAVFTGIENFTVNASGFAGFGPNDRISGSAVANRLVGGRGEDTLDGRAGNDTLVGGDEFEPDGDSDSFVFSVAPSAGNADQITDFASADDRIVLDGAVHASSGPSGTVRDGRRALLVFRDRNGARRG